ncbi:hypothetical protein [Saccharopolyspora shandongensis]|uniref:hypothetical protein n=1 Tax=Saccharopolyspora shandongensis TaxID=418495 RepID=UPI0033F4C8BD
MVTYTDTATKLRRIYDRQRAAGTGRLDAALIALNPTPNGPVMRADHAIRRGWNTVLDRFEDVCDLVDRTVVFPLDDLVTPRVEITRDRLRAWHLQRARRSIVAEIIRLESYAYTGRVRLVTAWAAVEDADAARRAEDTVTPPLSPIGDVLRALRTIEVARADALPFRNTSWRPAAPNSVEHIGGAFLDTMAFFWDFRDRQDAARNFRTAVVKLYGEQAADPVNVLYNLH